MWKQDSYRLSFKYYPDHSFQPDGWTVGADYRYINFFSTCLVLNSNQENTFNVHYCPYDSDNFLMAHFYDLRQAWKNKKQERHRKGAKKFKFERKNPWRKANKPPLKILFICNFQDALSGSFFGVKEKAQKGPSQVYVLCPVCHANFCCSNFIFLIKCPRVSGVGGGSLCLCSAPGSGDSYARLKMWRRGYQGGGAGHYTPPIFPTPRNCCLFPPPPPGSWNLPVWISINIHQEF